MSMTTTRNLIPFAILATFAAAIVAVMVFSPEGRGAPDSAGAVVTTIAPTTSAPPVTSTTSSTVKPAQVAKVSHRTSEVTSAPSTTAAATTDTTTPGMPPEPVEFLERIPPAETSEEMESTDCEFIHGCDDAPEVATDWVE